MFPKNKADFMVMTIIFIIFIGAATGGVLLHIRNQSIETELKQKKHQLAALKQELESVQNTASHGRETLNRLNNQFTPLVPFDRTQQEIFKEEMERIGNHNHLKIIKSELLSPPSVIKDNPEYQVSQWQLIFTGDYRGFTGFLEALPRNTKLAMIAKLNVTPEYLKENQYQLTARLTLDLISKSVTN
jgi:hypothetical protein